ncbi:MerR family regulatory protein [Raineyella antarctica]|uniref:MerR family regulatory protein n=1 Tax=Raineyella antarctica TaxID=1577474 RepID=A0A1G6GPZ2_9ACTN|nr:MerR family transcriptional regulator [Raineyella antarctica]SDB83825.1 MerR family regulatory protein [Raineyella antarctica]
MAEARHSIGWVVKELTPEFPDLSISKIRYLETEGLLSPERAPSGYRKYSVGDVRRLHYILTMQRTHYLPLKVIREHLDQIDRGLTPPKIDTPSPGVPAPQGTAPAVRSAQVPDDPPPADPVHHHGNTNGNPGANGNDQRRHRPVRLSRVELIEKSGISEPILAELERLLVVTPRRGTHYYDQDAFAVAVAAKQLASYGIDPRHLRQIKIAADKEVGLINQATAAHTRRGSSRQTIEELTRLINVTHLAMVRSGVQRELG